MQWVFEWDVRVAGVRGYACEDRETAKVMRERRDDFVATLRVTVIGDGAAEISYFLALGDAPKLTRQDFIRLARELYRHGIRRVYAQREGLLPWGERGEDGNVYVDIAALLGGDDGDY